MLRKLSLRTASIILQESLSVFDIRRSPKAKLKCGSKSNNETCKEEKTNSLKRSSNCDPTYSQSHRNTKLYLGNKKQLGDNRKERPNNKNQRKFAKLISIKEKSKHPNVNKKDGSSPDKSDTSQRDSGALNGKGGKSRKSEREENRLFTDNINRSVLLKSLITDIDNYKLSTQNLGTNNSKTFSKTHLDRRKMTQTLSDILQANSSNLANDKVSLRKERVPRSTSAVAEPNYSDVLSPVAVETDDEQPSASNYAAQLKKSLEIVPALGSEQSDDVYSRVFDDSDSESIYINNKDVLYDTDNGNSSRTYIPGVGHFDDAGIPVTDDDREDSYENIDAVYRDFLAAGTPVPFDPIQEIEKQFAKMDTFKFPDIKQRDMRIKKNKGIHMPNLKKIIRKGKQSASTTTETVTQSSHNVSHGGNQYNEIKTKIELDEARPIEGNTKKEDDASCKENSTSGNNAGQKMSTTKKLSLCPEIPPELSK